jgi:hypothetical protein
MDAMDVECKQASRTGKRYDLRVNKADHSPLVALDIWKEPAR